MRLERLEQVDFLKAAIARLGIEHVKDLHLFQCDATFIRAPHGAVYGAEVPSADGLLDHIIGQRAARCGRNTGRRCG